MFENEEEVMDDVTNEADVAADQSTEEGVAPVQQEPEAEPEKVYTEAEFKAKLEEMLDKKAPRMEARIRKEYDRKYGDLENVLRAGTGKNEVSEMADEFRQYYEGRGVQIPKAPMYSDRDTEILAKAEAEEFIDSGMEEVIAETDRLAKIGVENMSPREKAVFRKLAEYRKEAERGNELAKIGVTEDVYNGKEFRTFAAKFDANTPVTEIYEIFSKMQPRKDIKPMGSMTNRQEAKAKDYYTQEEIERLTDEELDDPVIWEAVRRSMTGR